MSSQFLLGFHSVSQHRGCVLSAAGLGSASMSVLRESSKAQTLQCHQGLAQMSCWVSVLFLPEHLTALSNVVCASVSQLQ